MTGKTVSKLIEAVFFASINMGFIYMFLCKNHYGMAHTFARLF